MVEERDGNEVAGTSGAVGSIFQSRKTRPGIKLTPWEPSEETGKTLGLC